MNLKSWIGWMYSLADIIGSNGCRWADSGELTISSSKCFAA